MPLFDSASAALDVSIRNSWNGGLVADLAFMPEDAVSGWTVEFEYAGTIVNIWNARIVSRTGDRYVVENLGYNSTVNAGGTAGFGFVGSGASDGITALAINGEPVGGSDPEPAPLPMVSIGDAVAAEEDGSIGFQLTLSEPSDTDVTVSYQTVAGTALAGSDFAAGNAQVVIPAGQISAVLSVALADDAAPEATEQFQVQLTGATGAEIADGEATGQITDSDVAPAPVPDPVVSLGDASVQEGDPDGGGTGNIATGLIVDGPLSTSGNQILDANGDAVQIRAVNWFGAENDVRAPHGLWQRPMTEMMDQMVEEGFNAIRLPFSVQNILEDLPATSVAGDPSLAGLTTLEIFDRIVDYAEEIGIKIILDAHRITQGNGAEGIWYAGQYDEADWIEAWELLANRYGDSDAVIGAD
ncbi:MAG: cellulase family glycosylhydrolase, partial [Pseudomonadota bacterium]